MQAEVATWAASVTTAPTRIIVMAGTNNYAGDTPSAALARLPGLLGAIGSIYPMAQIYLCSIPPSNGTIPARDAWIIEFNAGVPAVATAAGAAHVDINAGPYALTQADITGDAVHPTADGHAKIGNTIADSMGF
jgi:lysophospholipase L1-like esterase